MGMSANIELICFDADDTLWHNMRFYDEAELAFLSLLEPFVDPTLAKVEVRKVGIANLEVYGYGVKGFCLSLIEVAAKLLGKSCSEKLLLEIIDIGKSLLTHPVHILPNVEAVISELSKTIPLVMVTKGDLLHQEQKIGESGLGHFFSSFEIVSEKNAEVFLNISSQYGISPGNTVVVGDSVRSDILPALEAGAFGIHVPIQSPWTFEDLSAPNEHHNYRLIKDFSELPGCLREVSIYLQKSAS